MMTSLSEDWQEKSDVKKKIGKKKIDGLAM